MSSSHQVKVWRQLGSKDRYRISGEEWSSLWCWGQTGLWVSTLILGETASDARTLSETEIVFMQLLWLESKCPPGAHGLSACSSEPGALFRNVGPLGGGAWLEEGVSL